MGLRQPNELWPVDLLSMIFLTRFCYRLQAGLISSRSGLIFTVGLHRNTTDNPRGLTVMNLLKVCPVSLQISSALGAPSSILYSFGEYALESGRRVQLPTNTQVSWISQTQTQKTMTFKLWEFVHERWILFKYGINFNSLVGCLAPIRIISGSCGNTK